MAINLCLDLGHGLMSKHLVIAQPERTPHFTAFAIALHVALAGFEITQVIGIVFYWLGRQWARWFVLVGCLLYVTTLKDLGLLWAHSRFSGVLTLSAGLLAFYLIWYLHTRPVREWFARGAAKQAEPAVLTAL